MSIETTVIPTTTVDGSNIVGDIVLGRNNLKGINLLFREHDNEWRLINKNNQVEFCNIVGHNGRFYIFSTIYKTSFFRTFHHNNAVIIGQSWDTGVGMTEIFRMVGSAEPHFLLTHAKVGARALPTPSADFRGFIYRVEGGAGVADSFYICLKDVNDAYRWHRVDNVLAPGDLVFNASDTSRSLTNTPQLTKIKEFVTLTDAIYRVKFDLRSSHAGHPIFAQIFKNGIAWGTQRQNSTQSYITFSEDLAFAKGDRIQLFVRADGGLRVHVRNFRLCVEEAVASAVLMD